MNDTQRARRGELYSIKLLAAGCPTASNNRSYLEPEHGCLGPVTEL